jgi:methionine biosynthesis protein MetW
MMQDPREVLRQMMRVAQRSIVSVPNFGHWKNRLYLLTQGRMPVTSTLSYQWYDTPNIHFCTIRDFVVLCDELGFRITDRYYLKASGEVARFGGKGPFANVFGEQGIFLISRI